MSGHFSSVAQRPEQEDRGCLKSYFTMHKNPVLIL